MTNKILLAAIALGLWANAIASFVRPARADAESYLAQIAHDMHSLANGDGGCRNTKICD